MPSISGLSGVANKYKIVLPELRLTTASSMPSEGVPAVTVAIPEVAAVTYYPVPVMGDRRAQRLSTAYRVFPVVLCGDGSPWAEANVWLLSVVQLKTLPNMLTLGGLAEDLGAFRRYLEDEGIDWLDFPAHKLKRPTYRYNGFLNLALQAGEVPRSLAKRRMATVIRFYRWLMQEANFTPAHSPWIDRDRYVAWKDEAGFAGGKTVTTTDVSVKAPAASDPYDDHIVDGGRLRPLTHEEQHALVECLDRLGNTEMTLIHLVSLFTGARIQTVLTLRVKYVFRPLGSFSGKDIRMRVGPGTGIDTKGGKAGVLHLPRWLYEQLYIYAHSDRAAKRRALADEGDSPDQCLFLSHRGALFYDTQEKLHGVKSSGRLLRHIKTGQGVRQFMLEKLVPALRVRLKRPNFTFKFHDLRATFGMNVVDSLGPLMDASKLTYSQALDQLRQLLWHKSMKTTEGYLEFRVRRQSLDALSDGWNEHLSGLAMRSLGAVKR